MGVMQEIRVHLSRGKSSGELIDMGYAPGTVYRLQREYREASHTAASEPDLTGHLSFFRDGEGLTAVWHPESPLQCPGCGEYVGHWQMCRHCNKLIPSGCRCAANSPAMREGFALGELLQ